MGIIMGQGILFHRLQKMIKTRKLDNELNSKIIIPRIPIVTNDTSPPVPFKWTQFPVLGAYYITLNWDKVTFWSLLIYILIRGTSVWLHSLNQDAIKLMSSICVMCGHILAAHKPMKTVWQWFKLPQIFTNTVNFWKFCKASSVSWRILAQATINLIIVVLN